MFPLSDEAVEVIARVCHEANRAYCIGLGDYSQVLWESSPEWQRESAIAGVRTIVLNPDTTPEQSHEDWLELKRKDGWVYGPTKDPDSKTHPCMVAYAELPEPQRRKDALFGAVVRSLV